MKAQLTPTSLKAGSILYYASVYTDDETNKTEVDVQVWVIRSIKKKRGSQTKHGHKFLVDKWDRNDNVYVNMTRKEPYVSVHHKTGEWLKSIPAWCKQQFNQSNERLPSGFYTTQEAALRSVRYGLEEDLKDAKRPPEKRIGWITPEPIPVIEKELRMVKSRLTKIKNKKAKK